MPRTDRTLAPLLALALLGAPVLGVTSAGAASAAPAASVSTAEGSAPRLIGTSTGGVSRLRLLSRPTVKGRPAVKPAPKPKLPAARKPVKVVVPVAKPIPTAVAKPVVFTPPVTPAAAPLHLPYDGPTAAAAPVSSPTAVPLAAPVAPVAVPVTETTSATTAAASTSYKFLNVDLGKPVRWNPCQTVPWTFNPDNAPAGGFEAVQAAMTEIGRITGLQMEFKGTTSEVPNGAYLTQAWRSFKPMHVGWTSSAASDMLAGYGPGTIGVARVLWTGSYADDGSNRTQIASAAVALNSASRAATSGPGSWYTYTLHELGHAFGLAHVDDETQIMNPVISSRLGTYGAGDTVGLQKLGAGEGCLPSIR